VTQEEPEPPQRERLAEVAQELLSPVLVVSAGGVVEYINHAGAAMLRQEPSWLLGRAFVDLVHPGDRLRVEGELGDVGRSRPSGRFSDFRARGQKGLPWQVFEGSFTNLLHDPDISGLLISLRDVTEGVARETGLKRAAYRDALTGLPNRARILVELAAQLRANEPVAVALAAVDRLSLINDSLGHGAGDQLMRAVGGRLKAMTPRSGMAGRLDSDVFVVLLPGVTPREAGVVAWRLLERVREPIFLAGREVAPSVSIGLFASDLPAGAEEALSDAGVALRRAKVLGGGRVEVFRPQMRVEAVARLEMEANLRRALKDQELRLAFQPIVRLPDRVAVKSEALLRWTHDGTEIGPQTFIPLAEEIGLIVEVGDWVLDKALSVVSRVPGTRVSVNVSARQLVAPGLVEDVRRALEHHRVAPDALEIEITETALVEGFEHAVSVLGALRRLGIRVGLDDFGTGYSSLGYLRRLPIDFLKLDRSLTADLDVHGESRTIVAAVLQMADALGIEVVAEGVEREGQVDALNELGIRLAQGFLLGTPTELGLGDSR
jgi:diguanylate cyclase (GGDEF)-like protein